MIRQNGWYWYLSGEKSKLENHKCGKWMHFFENQSFALKICEKAITENVCYKCKLNLFYLCIHMMSMRYDVSYLSNNIIKFLFYNISYYVFYKQIHVLLLSVTFYCIFSVFFILNIILLQEATHEKTFHHPFG